MYTGNVPVCHLLVKISGLIVRENEKQDDFAELEAKMPFQQKLQDILIPVC